MSLNSFWVFGAGRFGRLACERLLTAKPFAQIRVVDRECQSVPSGVERVCGEATDFLSTNLTAQADVWIVPAVPVHLAYEWLADRLTRKRALRTLNVPEDVLTYLPNPMRGPQGQVYCSNANFRCPDDCPESQSLCTVTAKPRPLVMHAHLSALDAAPYVSVVLRSLQLAPGVGGFRAASLRGFHNALKDQRGHFLFSTACKCHAVVNAFALD